MTPSDAPDREPPIPATHHFAVLHRSGCAQGRRRATLCEVQNPPVSADPALVLEENVAQ